MESSPFLRANCTTYEWLVRRARAVNPRVDPEEALARITKAGAFACIFHPGRFTDGALENIAFEIGQSLQMHEERGHAMPPSRRRLRRRVLHITPRIALGGHAAFIRRWITTDRDSAHSLVLVDQSGEVPAEWSDYLRSAGGNLIVLTERPRLAKALELRRIAIETADLIVWHVIDTDVVPIVAFAVPGCPPVAIVDHCDHQFWLGGSVASMLINLRSVGFAETAARRYIPRATVLPIPVQGSRDNASRSHVRRTLGVDDDRVMLLSVGRDLKFRPSGSFNFAATVGKVLDLEPYAEAYVIGTSLEEISPFLSSPVHPRLYFRGPLDSAAVSEYSAAADVYLESFPFGSQTALLEAVTAGLPVVPAYAPLASTLVASIDSIRDIASNPRDEAEYVERVRDYIRNKQHRERDGALLERRVTTCHGDDAWRSALSALYKILDSLVPAPRPIPVTRPEHNPVDIGLARWKATTNARDSYGEWTDETAGVAARHACYVAKWAGDYRSARSLALDSVMQAPRCGASWRLLAGSLLGPARQAIQVTLNG